MFALDGVLIIRKPFYKLAELLTAYAADHAQYGKGSAFVVHLRYSTHGDKGESNVHPHSLADGTVGLVHNGILHDFSSYNSPESDTVRFCNSVLVARSAEQLVSKEFGDIMGKMIDYGNKFILLDCNGNVSIVNEECGLWDGQRWYSNSGYLPAKPIILPPCNAGSLCGSGGPAGVYKSYLEYSRASKKERKRRKRMRLWDDYKDDDARKLPTHYLPVDMLDTDALHEKLDREAIEAMERDAYHAGDPTQEEITAMFEADESMIREAEDIMEERAEIAQLAGIAPEEVGSDGYPN